MKTENWIGKDLGKLWSQLNLHLVLWRTWHSENSRLRVPLVETQAAINLQWKFIIKLLIRLLKFPTHTWNHLKTPWAGIYQHTRTIQAPANAFFQSKLPVKSTLNLTHNPLIMNLNLSKRVHNLMKKVIKVKFSQQLLRNKWSSKNAENPQPRPPQGKIKVLFQ